MRAGFSRLGRPAVVGLRVLGVAWVLATAPAFGQIPQPDVPDIHERSGLLRRFVPIEPHLPPDPRRDSFYDTRFGDHADTKHPNSIRGGGLYGKLWKVNCTASVYPFFYGAPGRSSITEDCRPPKQLFRLYHGLFHPFRPVDMYYDQGSYVPVHDFNPLVPGPGSFPIPWYYTGPRGG